MDDGRRLGDGGGHPEVLRHIWTTAICGTSSTDGCVTECSVELIDKWLKAGVLEDGERRTRTAGTPQGGVISPLLANIYLHEVLDTWFAADVKPRLRAQAFLVRYADDFVIVFALRGGRPAGAWRCCRSGSRATA